MAGILRRAAAALAAAVMLSGCSGTQELRSVSLFAMDTYMTVTASGGDAEKALSAAKTEAERLDALWSTTSPDSEISRINGSGGAPVTVSAETAELIAFAADMGRKTSGALDITLYALQREWGFTTGEYKIPSDERITALLADTGCGRLTVDGNTVTVPAGMSIDLGSVGKGAAGDRLISVLKEQGVTSALLDLGGNIQTLGRKPDGSLWRIGIKDPEGEGILGSIEVSDCAVVTSGCYERYFTEGGKRYHHILDPATGRPAESGLLSATAIGSSGRLCDAVSTAAFVLGADKALELAEQLGDIELILVTESRELVMTEGIKGKFSKS